MTKKTKCRHKNIFLTGDTSGHIFKNCKDCGEEWKVNTARIDGRTYLLSEKQAKRLLKEGLSEAQV